MALWRRNASERNQNWSSLPENPHTESIRSLLQLLNHFYYLADLHNISCGVAIFHKARSIKCKIIARDETVAGTAS